MDKFQTTRFSLENRRQEEVRKIMTEVLEALEEKGYHPVNQLVGYFLSDDPTYVTNYKNARSIIRRLERDELLEEILKCYFQQCRRSEASATGARVQQLPSEEADRRAEEGLPRSQGGPF